MALRRPVVHNGGAVRRPLARPRRIPFLAAESLAARASPFPARDAFSIGDSRQNNCAEFDARIDDSIRSHGPNIRGEWNRSAAPRRDCPKPSTTHDRIDSQQVRIIHPFHPLCGQSFRFVVSKKLWGDDRVTIQLADGSLFSVPVTWTDVIPADAYVSVGDGRSQFRVEDLMALADLMALRRRR